MPNKIEWVKPLCDTRCCDSLCQKAVMKSISGTLWANAPRNKALLPNCFPAMASPMQAPKTICVTESKE